MPKAVQASSSDFPPIGALAKAITSIIVGKELIAQCQQIVSVMLAGERSANTSR
jgi:hypothetical protein